jgi:hypothetical protein
MTIYSFSQNIKTLFIAELPIAEKLVELQKNFSFSFLFGFKK